MRLYYKNNNNVYEHKESSDGMNVSTYLSDIDDVTSLVSSGDAVLYESQGEMRQQLRYSVNRRNEYPSIQDQLDKMYHDGFDAWKETIQAVKDAHPKPE